MDVGGAGGRRSIRDTSSAEKFAYLRALAALEKDPCVRGPDYMAADFLADIPTARASLRWAARWPTYHAAIRWSAERLGPGAYWSHIARAKHFDKVFLEAISEGAGQVVILDAGLDSRAYRFSSELSNVSLFEVDRPVIAARKVERLKAMFGELPAAVTYVSADLSDGLPGELLSANGLDGNSPVLVVWNAGAPFLAADAVTDVLGWVSTLPTGSSVVFDYLDQAFFDRGRGKRRLSFGIEMGGERFMSGFDPAAMPALLEGCGLTLRSHLGPRDQEAAYLCRSDGSLAGRPVEQARIAHAVVPAP